MTDTTPHTDEQKNQEEITEEQKVEKQESENLSEVELLQKKCDEYLAGWQRAKADYINYKKEAEQKQGDLIQYANAALLAELIPVYDNFKMAFGHQPESDDKEWKNWQVGIEHIKKQMWEFISRFGVTEIKTVGEKFNPQIHESVAKRKSGEHESGVIIEEAVPGYMLHDKLLNPAKVIVAE